MKRLRGQNVGELSILKGRMFLRNGCKFEKIIITENMRAPLKIKLLLNFQSNEHPTNLISSHHFLCHKKLNVTNTAQKPSHTDIQYI